MLKPQSIYDTTTITTTLQLIVSFHCHLLHNNFYVTLAFNLYYVKIELILNVWVFFFLLKKKNLAGGTLVLL